MCARRDARERYGIDVVSTILVARATLPGICRAIEFI
jgi:hypothetical protein